MEAAVFDDRACHLGEGPLWHPERRQLFWFDILGKRLLTRAGDQTRHWQFDRMVSAAGWIDRDRLLIASETGLFAFDLETGAQTPIVDIETDDSITRSNDGRADPWGGFWIGTMGKKAEPGAGAFYRFHRGELRRLYPAITVTNAICFAPDSSFAFFADTETETVMKVTLDPETGWPQSEPELFLDLTGEGLKPDGAVIDRNGVMWLAQWGAGRVAAYGPDGRFLRAIAVAAPQTTCPAFGGDDFTTLFCTTARENMDAEALAAHPRSGMTFTANGVAPGQAEHRVVL